MGKPKIYLVKWIDSQSDDGWQFYKERTSVSPMIVYTIGFLIFENKKSIRIATSLAQNSDKTNKQFNGTIIIPKSAIREKKIIKNNFVYNI